MTTDTIPSPPPKPMPEERLAALAGFEALMAVSQSAAMSFYVEHLHLLEGVVTPWR